MSHSCIKWAELICLNHFCINCIHRVLYLCNHTCITRSCTNCHNDVQSCCIYLSIKQFLWMTNAEFFFANHSCVNCIHCRFQAKHIFAELFLFIWHSFMKYDLLVIFHETILTCFIHAWNTSMSNHLWNYFYVNICHLFEFLHSLSLIKPFSEIINESIHKWNNFFSCGNCIFFSICHIQHKQNKFVLTIFFLTFHIHVFAFKLH